MALYAFDGTWNSQKDDDDARATNTNVVRFFEAYQRHSGTHDFYVEGVGTRFDFIGRVIGGLFGAGELARLDEAYDHLCRQWAAGDHVIDIVGFSRGAATTLDFCHLLQKRGIRMPGQDRVVEANPKVRFLGVWDVVAAFGLANLGNTALNIGHHLSLPQSNLQFCFHALALDERRPSFLPSRLHGAYEVWFRGVHSDVGGGNGNVGLSDISLQWMMRKAKAAGLPIEDGDVAALRPNPTTAPLLLKLPVAVRLVGAVDRYHYSVSPMPGCTTPPATCKVETQADEITAIPLGEPVELLTEAEIQRIEALWSTATATAKALEFEIASVKGPLVGLFQARISLVSDSAKLAEAKAATARLVTEMIHGAQTRGFHVMNEFFLNEALFNLPRLFPFTD